MPEPKHGGMEAVVLDYINENFKLDDWLAIVAINRKNGKVVQRMAPARIIVRPDYQRWLRFLNVNGFDVYMSLNTFKVGARRRTKKDLKEIRHLYLDLDEDGARKLEAIRQDEAVPALNCVLNTSPGKFQVIWRVEGIGREQAEIMLRGLVLRFGGDPAATDSTRVFRLPGFNNKKYAEDFRVTIGREAPAVQVYRSDDFKIQGEDRLVVQPVSASPGSPRPYNGQSPSQSERDWHYAIRKLMAGVDPEQIIQDIACYRSRDRYDNADPAKLIAPAKPKPNYYAERTVNRARGYLEMVKRPVSNRRSVTSSREAISGDALQIQD